MSSKRESKRQHGLLILAVFLLLLAASTFGTIFYLQSKINSPRIITSPAIRGSFPTSGKPILTSEERKVIIDKARLIRNEWKIWASQHHDLLSRMIHSSGEDRDTLMQVYDALPETPMAQESG